MHRTRFLRALCALLCTLLFFAVLPPFLTLFADAPAEQELPLRYCYTTASIRFRKAPNLNPESKYDFSFGKHQVLPVLEEVEGDSYDGSTLWYKVRYTNLKDGKCYVGYVHSTLVFAGEKLDYETEEFAKFPQSYRPALAALKAAHPTWTFLPLETEKDFSSAVSAQAVVSVNSRGDLSSPSFIDKSYASVYRSTVTLNGMNAATTLLDGGTKYCASEATVAYFMDPRNFLNDVDIFMFSAQAYDESIHTLESVEKMVEGTYMATLTTVNDREEEVSYAEAFLDAAKLTGISPYYLLITSFAENGTVGTGLSMGNHDGIVCTKAGCDSEEHRGYYNFYGIGSTPGGSPQHNGLLYAMEKGWNTAYKAIVGGASFQGDNYINNGQQTAYLKKFNVNPASPNGIWHQYMQNLTHPETEALFTFRSMQEHTLTELSHEFLIPVYNDMPQTVSPLPTVDSISPVPPSGGGEGSGGETPEGGEPTEPPAQEDPPAEELKPFFESQYTMTDDGFMYGIAPKTEEKAFRSRFTLGEETTLSISSAAVGTGTQVRILFKGEVIRSYTAVVRGDVSGNGGVEALDLLYLRDYLLGKKDFASAYKAAADIDGDGKVNSLDLLKLRDANLGLYTISQKG
ncbi:MAG: hypothetical protein IKT43_02355 [Clostridia bacterium]|nr:hypothetical protein [Clostridia bacterium]